MKISNIWNCFETDCWSRGFNYDGYIELHRSSEQTHSALDTNEYSALCLLLDHHVENSSK